MALFTDGPLSALEDLQNYENAILSVASTESVDLAAKITLAQEETANQLMLFLLRRLPLRDLQWSLRRQKGVSDVVVTAPLRQWHAHKTLALVYRDAYNNQLNDRYKGKWTEYEQLTKESFLNYFRIGVGMVADPVSKAAAPALSAVPGSGTGAIYYTVVAWLNKEGQEGSPSDVAELTTTSGEQLNVTAVNPPSNASGWNVYVGKSPDATALQNVSPIGIGSSWTMTAGLQQGAPPSSGQPPEWFLVDQHVIERG